MGVQTSITAATPGNLFFRTGSIAINGVNIGALEGDITFSVRREYDIPELAGAIGELKGTRHILKEEAFLTVTMAEWNLATLQYAIQGVDISSNASSQVLGSSGISENSEVGCISDGSYYDLVFTGEQCDDLQSTILMRNVVVDGDFELQFRDKGHFTCAVTFKSTADPADPDSRTWAITHKTA